VPFIKYFLERTRNRDSCIFTVCVFRIWAWSFFALVASSSISLRLFAINVETPFRKGIELNWVGEPICFSTRPMFASSDSIR